MHDRGSNSRPLGSDTMMEGLPLPVQLYHLSDIEGASETFYHVPTLGSYYSCVTGIDDPYFSMLHGLIVIMFL
jgi:hypothetical protein